MLCRRINDNYKKKKKKDNNDGDDEHGQIIQS